MILVIDGLVHITLILAAKDIAHTRSLGIGLFAFNVNTLDRSHSKEQILDQERFLYID